jgi:hypothetical protein
MFNIQFSMLNSQYSMFNEFIVMNFTSLRAKRSNLKSHIVIASEAKQSQKYYPQNNYEIASDYRPRNDDKTKH